MANTSSSFDLSTAVPIDGSAAAPPQAASTGFDLSTATPIEKPKEDKEKPADEPSTDWARQIALAGRAASQGVVGALTLPNTVMTAAGNIPAYIANKFGGNYPYKTSLASKFSDALTQAGAPVAQTSGEQLAGAGISGLTGGLAGGAAGAPGLLNAVRSGAAGTTGALSQEGARQVGLPAWVQTGVGLLGSQLPALGESTARTISDLAAPLTRSGQTRAAGTLLNSEAQDPAAAQSNLLYNSKPIVPNSAPTTGAMSQDTGLLGVEKAVRGTSAPEFGDRLSDQNAARQTELTNLGGTPQDLANAIAARATATAPLYATAATHSAPIDNELTALMQRPAMQDAIRKAQELQANRGGTFGLSTHSPGTPMAITGSDAQAIKMALDDMRTNADARALGIHQTRALQGTINDFNNWVGQNIPAQKQADATFQSLSGPINKMQTVQGLQQNASTTSADVRTGQYFLSPANYSNALDKILANGQHGLAPADITRLESLRKDLENSQAVNGPMLKAPGSDTFQNLSLNQNIQGPAAFLTKPLAPLYKLGGADNAVNSLLTRAMLDPQFAAGLMQKAGAPKSGLNFRPYDLGTLGGLLGSAP